LLSGSDRGASGHQAPQVLCDVDDIPGVAAVEQLVPDDVIAGPAGVMPSRADDPGVTDRDDR
jgi:hypothetical protein